MSFENPSQSMTCTATQRFSVYEAIEQHRGRPLIVYATSTRPGTATQISGEAVREVIDQMDMISSEVKSVDLLLHSYGGDGLVACRIMTLLRERFESVSVLVPFAAFSAATILSLGATEIVMHPRAHLGPIDAQITLPNGISFSYGEIERFIDELVTLDLNGHTFEMTPILMRLLAEVSPLQLGFARRSHDLSQQLAHRMLRFNKSQRSEEEVAIIANDLRDGFLNHSDGFGRVSAGYKGLPIANPDPILENLLWKAFLGVEERMRLRKIFNANHDFLACLQEAQLARLPIEDTVCFEYLYVLGLCESTRKCSEYVIRGKMFGPKNPIGEFEPYMQHYKVGWHGDERDNPAT